MNFEHLGIKSKSYALCLQYKSSQKVNKRLHRWRGRRLDVVRIRRDIVQLSRDLATFNTRPEEEVLSELRQGLLTYHDMLNIEFVFGNAIDKPLGILPVGLTNS